MYVHVDELRKSNKKSSYSAFRVERGEEKTEEKGRRGGNLVSIISRTGTYHYAGNQSVFFRLNGGVT